MSAVPPDGGHPADLAPTRYVDADGITFAYRRLGPRGRPLLVLNARFRGTIDHWDPAFLDALARERDVVVFDNAGINASTGEVPTTIGGMADNLFRFLGALGVGAVDLLGWSMGGFVAQAAALAEPSQVRRLVIAASGPGPVPNTPARGSRVGAVSTKAVNDDEDFLYMFFPGDPKARQVGTDSLRRLDKRLLESHAALSPAGVSAQGAAMARWSTTAESAWDRLHELRLPVLVANGAQDVMIPAYQSYAMSQRLPNAKIVIYSDAGHGFLFQHPRDFAAEVLRFLSAPDEPRP